MYVFPESNWGTWSSFDKVAKDRTCTLAPFCLPLCIKMETGVKELSDREAQRKTSAAPAISA